MAHIGIYMIHLLKLCRFWSFVGICLAFGLFLGLNLPTFEHFTLSLKPYILNLKLSLRFRDGWSSKDPSSRSW